MPPSTPPAIFAPDHGVDALGPVVLVFARKPPSEEVFEVMRAKIEAARVAFPTGIGFFQVVDNERNPSTEASRRAYMDMLDRYRSVVKGVAFVLLREGFGGAAIRSIISGVVLAARPPFPVKALATIEEAADWLSSTLGRAGVKAPAASQLAAAGRDLAARVAAGSASLRGV